MPSGPVPTGRWTALSDMRACSAWLLWTHRMESPLGGLTGPGLVDVARARGIALTTYDITRAENGKGHVDPSVVTRYEQLLGLSPASLSAPLRAAARMVPGALGSAALLRMRSVPDTAQARSDLMNRFHDRTQRGGALRAQHWLQLADTLTAVKETLLPDTMVGGWIRRLMDECMRSVDPAYYPRLEALSTLAGDDRYAMHFVQAAKELTSVPGMSGAKEAWAVVGDIRDPDAIDALVKELPTVPDERFDYYSVALAMPAHVGALNPEQTQAVAGEIERRLSNWSLYSYEPLAQLAAELPAELATHILRRIDRVHPMSRLTGARDGRDVQAEVDYYTRAAMTDRWPEHPSGSLLPELLRVILANQDTGSRFHAATLIRWSPLTASVCDAAADVCVSDREPAARQMAAYLVSRLATPASENRLRRLLEETSESSIVTSALVALAHSGVLNEQDDLVRYMKDPRYRGTAIYAAGITGHPSINADEADSTQAAWWRNKGGGVWD